MVRPEHGHAEVLGPQGRPRVALVIPTLNEEEPIAAVIRAVPRDVVDEVIVADSGSEDRTVERARAAGARVIIERQRGRARRYDLHCRCPRR